VHHYLKYRTYASLAALFAFTSPHYHCVEGWGTTQVQSTVHTITGNIISLTDLRLPGSLITLPFQHFPCNNYRYKNRHQSRNGYQLRLRFITGRGQYDEPGSLRTRTLSNTTEPEAQLAWVFCGTSAGVLASQSGLYKEKRPRLISSQACIFWQGYF
jgi:hypothetical protein